MNGATGTGTSEWFLDETSILQELRLATDRRGAPPVMPGYDDLREIQRGGQGVVYAGVQRSTRRRVAVKVLLDGAFASATSRRRFEREIDLVASLRHPNIVRVYDSGVTPPPDERVFLVMEFIEGVPLQEHARELDIPGRLRLFAAICRAVGHAHQRGVIHRDLKPSNIRVDGDGQPHILDFGLAKTTAVDAPAEVQSLAVSIAGQFVGSLPWASPEQFEGDLEKVDIRSDVYSLGVILYQMLTDRFPYSVEGQFRSVIENILTAAPARPSTVNRMLDDDVETIALKCLAKEPERRYQSAAELAADVERYLEGEPIAAKRDSTWYTMRKRLRQYRMLAGAAALLMVALCGGIAATAWQAHVARQERIRADDERDVAQRRFNDVRALARTFMFDFYNTIENLAGSRPARELLVTTALEYLQKLADEAGEDPALQHEIATAFLRVGDIQGSPFMANLGDTAGAMKSYLASLDIRRKLADADPADIQHQWLLARTLNQIGDVHQFSGDHAQAIEHYQRALDRLNPLMATGQQDARVQREIAASHLKTGESQGWMKDLPASLTSYQRARDLIAELAAVDPSHVGDQLNLSVCYSKVAYRLNELGHTADALENHRRALEISERAAEADPDNAAIRRTVAINLNQVGFMLSSAGDKAAAIEHFERALGFCKQILAADPKNTLAQSDVGYTYNKIGEMHFENDPAAALDAYQQALSIHQASVDANPGHAQYQRSLAVSLSYVGNSYVALSEIGADVNEGQAPTLQQAEHLRQARDHYQRCLNVLADMKSRGQLADVDANTPDEITQKIAKCEEQLAQAAQ